MYPMSMLSSPAQMPAPRPSNMMAQGTAGDIAGTMSAKQWGDTMQLWRKGTTFTAAERDTLESAKTRRKADIAQLFFYDHYADTLTYLGRRKQRQEAWQNHIQRDGITNPQDQLREWHSFLGKERVLLRKRRTRLKLDEFQILTQVGQGGYGEVFLARHKETQDVVALKKMRKKTLSKMDEVRHVLVERDILATTNSPWLVRLLYAFQDPTYVYLAMDFIAGGDFRTLLNSTGVLKEVHARFYISEMICSVSELHKLGYIHRDLKPENFLIDTQGHIKLTDFGLASGLVNPSKIDAMKSKLDAVKDDRELRFRSTVEMKTLYKTLRETNPRYADSIVGSPDYMAIEILEGRSYSFAVDYWSLGCILFEFLAGFPPFSGASPQETWTNLKNWYRVLRRPHYDKPEDQVFNLSDAGWQAIVSLITSQERRLSSIEQLRRLPFFQDVPFETLRETAAPFIPALDSEVDSGYFDDFTNEADMAKYAEVREKQQNIDALRDRDDNTRGLWVGFTFKAKRGEPKPTEGGELFETLF